VQLRAYSEIVHFSSKNEENNQLFDEFLGGKGAVLGETVRFISRDGLMQWSPLALLPNIYNFQA
jgi:hypothetical protein